jgi:alpha-L-arabinofuranosidase
VPLPSCLHSRAALLAVCSTIAVAKLAGQQARRAAEGVIRGDSAGAVIAPEVYGQFAEHLGRGIYDGVWVGPESPIPNTRGFRNDVVAALKAIKVPVIRWPGGCFADDYHWRDGVGPRASRPVRVNVLWGGVEESNAMGTHEFYDLAEQIGAKAYLAGNVGSATVVEMGQWLEYLTSPTRSTIANERRANGRALPFPVDFFGVGNENWGCGGAMTVEHYADQYRNYAEFVRSPQTPRIVKVASGPSGDDYHWTEVMMARATAQMDALSLHHYTVPSGNWDKKGAATSSDESLWMTTMVQAMRMEEMITRHSAIMDKFDPKKRVALYVDEWGVWHDVEPGTNPGFLYQQNTVRDAVVAGLTLNIFHAHADRVRLAAIAQMVNVLQAMILTEKDRMVLTPTYHVFDMYTVFQGATQLPVTLQTPTIPVGDVSVPGVSVSAARGKDGSVHVAFANLSPTAAMPVSLRLPGITGTRVTGRVLTGATLNAHNTFAAPAAVAPAPFNGASVRAGVLSAELPARSVVVLTLR